MLDVTITGMAWIKLSSFEPHQLVNLRESLTVYPRKVTDISAAEDPQPIQLFVEDEERGLIGLPRAFYLRNKTLGHHEIVRVSRGEPMAALETNFVADGPFKEQDDALRVLEQTVENQPWAGMLLKAGCGFGKTVVAIEFARRLGLRTLVLVHKEFFLKQWREQIRKFIPDAKVGRIQQDQCDYDGMDFSIGMIQSLSRDTEKAKYPEEMYRSFGLVITDECHRIGAATWSYVLPRFPAAYRLGLTATPRRKDGAQDVFFDHIGPIVYKARTGAMVPLLRRIKTGAVCEDINRGRYQVKRSKLNSAQVISQLGSNEFRSRAIADDVAQAVRRGRKVMVVSERLDHLRQIARQLNDVMISMKFGTKQKDGTVKRFIPVIDFYTGSWFTGEVWETQTKAHRKGAPKTATRSEAELQKAETANVIMATKQMVEEGLDIQALDVIVLATPMSDIEQSVGRVRRWCTPEDGKCEKLCSWRAGSCEGKPQPIVVNVIDEKVYQAKRRWNTRAKYYRSIGAL